MKVWSSTIMSRIVEVTFGLDGWLPGALRLVTVRGRMASREEDVERRFERVIFFIGVSW
jgi:hypothetical protein